jgi:hypothetical protein
MDDSRVKKAADILSTFFDETTLRAATQFETVRSTWRQIVGQRLADHSRPKSVVRHTLLIAADHAGWIQLLQIDQARILARIAKYYPELEVTSLAFTVEELRGCEDFPSAGAASHHGGAESDQALPVKSSAAEEAGAVEGEASTSRAQRRSLPEPLKEIFLRLMRGTGAGDTGDTRGN